MADKLLPLKLPPGVYKNGTLYQAKGRWFDSQLVRFIDDTIQPVGGWRRLQDAAGVDFATLAGVPRAAVSWRDDVGNLYIAIGTTQKLYVIVGGALFDITPVGFVAGVADSGYASGAGTFGHGAFGAGFFGTGTIASNLTDADTWQLDVFGQYLVAVSTSDHKLYVWTGNTATPAAQAAGSPLCDAVVVTPERFLVAIGAAGNVRLVQWADQETTATWTPTSTNQAGDFPLTTQGRLMAGRRTRAQTLLWTDNDVFAMTYIGAPFVYRFEQVGSQCGLLARNAVAAFDTQAVWMGLDNFFLYDGFVRPISCEVRDHVFGDFNATQAAKVWAMTVAEYGEVWWFYPSASSSEIDRYVVYSYREGHWTVGELSRTAGFDASATTLPFMASAGGLLYQHEIGDSRLVFSDTQVVIADGSVIASGEVLAFGTDQVEAAPFIESGPIEFGDGDNVVQAQRLLPDEKTLGDVEGTFYTAFYPTGAETAHGPYTMANPTPLRFTGRQVRVRYAQARRTGWRVGVPRLGVRVGGRR